MSEPVPPTLIDGSEPEPADDNNHRFEDYPPDHPLVKALERNKNKLAKLHERMDPDRLNDLETKAARLAEIEEAKKTQAEKDADRIAAESARADAAEAALLRYQVASDKGIPANAMKFLTGTTREEIEASAKDVLELIGEAAKPRTPKPDPNQGRTPPEATSPASQFASFLSNQLSNS